MVTESLSCRHAWPPLSLCAVFLIPGCQLVKKSLGMPKVMKKKEEGIKKAQKNLPRDLPHMSSIHAGSPPRNRLVVLLSSQQNNSCSQAAVEYPSHACGVLNFHFNTRTGTICQMHQQPQQPALLHWQMSLPLRDPVFPSLSETLLETQKSAPSFFLDEGRGTF